MRYFSSAAALACATFTQRSAKAQSFPGKPVKIGVLANLSAIHSSIGIKRLTDVAKTAIENFGSNALGAFVEIMSADVQNKADVAAATQSESRLANGT